MRKFFLKLNIFVLILSFVVGLGVLAPSSAEAQTVIGSCTYKKVTIATGETRNMPPLYVPEKSCNDTTITAAPGFKNIDFSWKFTGTRDDYDPSIDGGGVCGLSNPWKCIMDMLLFIPGYVSLLVLKLAQWLTHISGMMLNYVVQYTVVDMKKNLGNADVINNAWKTIRDIGNMGFIFVLLFAAIKTIIGSGEDNKKLIVRVVMVAILINFSLFFTRFVIDVSNVLAITFYDAIAPGTLGRTLTQGLSGSLMEPLKLASIFDTGALGGEKAFIVGVAGTIFALIAAFVFFAIAIMLVIRFVVLIFALILSPIAFLSFILPQMGGYRDQWWKALSGQAFFAPIFFLLTWVVIVVSRSLLKGGSFGDIAGTIGASGSNAPPPAGAMEMIVNFAIVISMLVFSLVMAKSWSNKAGPGVAGATKWAMGLAGAASFGLASRAGRYTIGAAAERFADSDRYKQLERDSAKSGLTGMKARLKLATADKARTSSFDARSAGIGSLLGGVPVGSAIGKGGFEADRKNFREFLEKPGTEAYKKRQERARKAGTELDILKNREEVERQRRIEEIEREARESGVMTPAQSAELEKLSPKYRIERIEEEARATGVMTPQQAAEIDKLTNKHKIERIEAEARATGVMTPEQAAQIEKLTKEEAEKQNKEKEAAATFENAITKASTKEIETIVDGNRKLLESQEFANKLNAQQLEALIKSDKLSEMEKDVLKNARFKDLDAAMALGGREITKMGGKIKGLSDAELEMINPDYLNNPDFIEQMRPPQRDSIMKSNRFTSTQKQAFTVARRQKLLNALAIDDAASARLALRNMTHDDVAVMKMSDLTHPTMLQAYSKQLLKRMAPKMNAADVPVLRQTIIDEPARLRAIGAVVPPELDEVSNWLKTADGKRNFS